MSKFSATTHTDVELAAAPEDVWRVLTDAQLISTLNPLIDSIDADGDLWRWQLRRISALGVAISPRCTERMSFDGHARIEFTHEPPEGSRERTGAAGWYDLTDTDQGTRLRIELTVTAELPLPKAAGPAVREVMKRTMTRTGDKFLTNLRRHVSG